MNMTLENLNTVTLPDLNNLNNSAVNIAGKLPFGIGQKKGYDSVSDVQ